MKLASAKLLTILAFIALGFNSTNAQCIAAFGESISNDTVQFTNQATGSYNWIGYDYGDGNFEAYIPNPTHVYPGPGIYQACQYIQDTMGFVCFDYKCDTLYLGGATCMADFFWWQNDLDIEYYSNALGIYDSLVWDFGDGTFSNDTMPIHTYANYGTYTACLSIYNGGTICDSSCQTIFLDSNNGSTCVADFTSSANGLNVNFTNTSTGSYNVQFWDFGDGFGTSQAANPSYSYFAPGTYNVCLSIYDTISGMCFSDICQDITVTSGGGGGTCQAAYTYTTNQLQFSGNNTSTGNYLTAIWDFGDGSNPSTTGDHTYTAAGTYSVCLTVGNIIPFCFSQECKDVTVSELTCDVDFEWSFNDQNVFAFHNLSQGNFTTVKWEFGDGNTSTFASPYYNYNIPGTYNVCLTTYDNGNVCGNACKSLDVYPLGQPELTNKAQFMAYPNPSNGSFTLSIPNAFNGNTTQVEIRDVSGRLIQSEQFIAQRSKNLEINAASGTYLMKISTGDFTQVLPIVIKL